MKREWTNLDLHLQRHRDANRRCMNARGDYIDAAGAQAIVCRSCGDILALSCSVPGCTHTRGRRKGEDPFTVREWWVCADHWRPVPRWMKAIVNRARKRARRLGTAAAWRAVDRLGRRTRTVAIQRAMGL